MATRTHNGRRRTALPRPVRPAQPARTRLDVAERREQLLALGVERFGSRAYEDVSIDEIAEAAGISKGLLYHYFPTKRAFYAATIRLATDRLVAETEAATPKTLGPLERLHAGLDAYLGFVLAHGPAYAALMRSGVGMDPEIARVVEGTRTKFLARLTEGLREQGSHAAGVRAAPLRPDAPLAKVALRGWVGLCEATSLAWVEAHDRPSKEAVRETLAAALIAIIAVLASHAGHARGATR